MRALREGLACAALLLVGVSALAAPAIVFRPLDLLAGTDACFANAVSSDGRVVAGWCETNQPAMSEPVRWDARGPQGLGFLAGSTDCSAAALSGDGAVVVGNCNLASGTAAFRWDAAGGMQDLGSLPLADPKSCYFDRPNVISFDGSVLVGDCVTMDQTAAEAFRWDAAGGMQGLGFLADTTLSFATGVSSDGTLAVGVSEPSDLSSRQGFLWDPDRELQSLGSLSDSFPNCSPTGASHDGSFVTGICYSAALTNAVAVAFRWDAANGVQSLGVPTGQSESSAFYISEDGAVVAGEADAGANTSQVPFRWDAAGIASLGVLPGLDSCEVTSLSADGSQLAGLCFEQSVSPAAFVWDAQNGMRDLRAVLAGTGNDLSAWLLSFGPVVSSDGRTFAGTGFHDGRDQAWVAPEASDSGGCWVALASLAWLARRDRRAPGGTTEGSA